MKRAKAKIPVYVQEYGDLAHITRSHVAYLARGAAPAFLRYVWNHGGELWGDRQGVMGGRSGPVWALPASSACIQPIQSQNALSVSLRALRKHGANSKVWTSGSAALKWIERWEGPGWTSPIEWDPRMEAVLADSIHAGPIDWRARVHRVPLVYLDQCRAYLRAMHHGVPGPYWDTHDAKEWRYLVLDPEERWCTASDVTIDIPAAILPRKTKEVTSDWDGSATVYQTGIQRLTLRGPLLRMALENGAEIVRYHGGMHSKRFYWDHAVAQWEGLVHSTNTPQAIAAGKAMYARAWGKYAAKDRKRGRIILPHEVRGHDVSTHTDDEGREHLIAWEPADDAPTCYRPDIAGEIVSRCAADTLRLAHRIEREGYTVAFLHVDAVCVVSDAYTPPEGWAIKGQGLGSVLGPGRYCIDDPDRGYVVGRLGLGPNDPWEWLDPNDPTGPHIWARKWIGDRSTPRDATGATCHRSGDYPWI